MKRLFLLTLLVVLASVLFTQANHGLQARPEEKNKALIRHFYKEVWGKGNLAVADEIFAANYVRHDPRGDTPPAPGPEGQKRIAAEFRKAIPSSQMTIDLMVAEGDFVVARWTSRGTHATGKKVEFVGVNIFRIANGKVVELWNHRDDLGLQQQIGSPTAPK